MRTTMPSHRSAEVVLLLRPYFRNARRTRTHGTIRQVSFRTSHVRIAADGRHVRHVPQSGGEADASPPSRRNVSETKNDVAEPRTQEISLFVAQRYSIVPESHLVDGHHVHRFGPRICVSYGNHRLVQPHDIIVAVIEHDGRRLLRGVP